MSDKKYELTNETINHCGFTLYRIKSLRDFDNIKAGDIGGYIEEEDNLSHFGPCWVYSSALVYGSAQVFGSAKVSGSARVYGSAKVYGSAQVFGSSWVYESAQVFGSALVYDSAQVSGSAWVSGLARVSGSALVRRDQEIVRNYDCRSISGFSYPITILPFHINIGCKTFDICDLDNAFSELPIEEVDVIKVIVEATMADIHRKIAQEKDK